MLALVVGAGVIGACAQSKRTTARTATPAVVSAPKTAAPVVPSQEEQDQADKQGQQGKNPRFGEAAAYLDGKAIGVIRVTELPPSLKKHIIDLGEGYTRTKYTFLEYARALGIDTKRLKGMHLYGGQRVVVVDQAELERIGEKITFSFTQGDRGKPRVHWPAMKLNVNTTIEMVSNVTFYMEKTPPVLNKDGELVYADGKLVEEGKVPYAPEEQGSGTRIYVDGALVGLVKRKKLDSTVAAKDVTDKFSLLAYAARLDPKAKDAKTIDLIAGDDVIGRVEKDATFVVPAKNRGQAVVDVPATDGAEQTARISAVQIFVRSAPPARTVTKISDAPEARLASGGGQGRSGDDDL